MYRQFQLLHKKSRMHSMAAMKNTSTGLEVILSTLFDRKMFCCNSILKRNAVNWYTTLTATVCLTMLLCSAMQTEMESRMSQVTFTGLCYILLIKQLHLTVQEDTIEAMFPILKLTQTTTVKLIQTTCSTLCTSVLCVEQD